MDKNQTERLGIWDRLFNRYRKKVIQRGRSEWKCWVGDPSNSTDYYRSWVDYEVTDRVTGSVTIERDYLS